MKTCISVFLCLFLASFSLFAQQLNPSSSLGKWKITKFGVSAGTDRDMVQGMDPEHFVQQIQGEAPTLYDDLTFDGSFSDSYICENPTIRLNLTFLPNPEKNFEVNFAAFGVWDRIDEAVYYTGDSPWSYNAEGPYLRFSSISNAVGLEGTASFFKPIGNWMRLYVGGGTQLEYSFNRDMYIEGRNVILSEENVVLASNDNNAFGNFESLEAEYGNYQLRNSFNQRLYAQVGLSFIWFRRLETGISMRGGFGYRAVSDAPVGLTRLESVSLNANWMLH